jgi:hypothetical protein
MSVRSRHEATNPKMTEAESLARTERRILNLARKEQPQSLQELRERLARSDVSVDVRLVNLAIFQLLNSHRLSLSADRRLRVDAGS